MPGCREVEAGDAGGAGEAGGGRLKHKYMSDVILAPRLELESLHPHWRLALSSLRQEPCPAVGDGQLHKSGTGHDKGKHDAQRGSARDCRVQDSLVGAVVGWQWLCVLHQRELRRLCLCVFVWVCAVCFVVCVCVGVSVCLCVSLPVALSESVCVLAWTHAALTYPGESSSP